MAELFMQLLMGKKTLQNYVFFHILFLPNIQSMWKCVWPDDLLRDPRRFWAACVHCRLHLDTSGSGSIAPHWPRHIWSVCAGRRAATSPTQGPAERSKRTAQLYIGYLCLFKRRVCCEGRAPFIGPPRVEIRAGAAVRGTFYP